MNILKIIHDFLLSILSRVHLVRERRQFTLTVITKRHGTSVCTSEKGTHAKKGQNDEARNSEEASKRE